VSTTPPLVEPPVAFLTASLLDTALREGPLARAGLALPPRGGAVWAPEILGHADVTADRRDAWFVLATTEIVLVVWVGHDDGRPLGRALDRGNPAVTLGAALMDGALGGRAIEPLPRPPGLVVAPIDPRTGRYVEGEGASVPEIFLGGTQPKPLPEEDAPAAAASAPIDAE
jgi:penicillin-binding protein 1A